MNEIKNVLVVGSGTMGRGIAQSFLRGGHRVTVLSRDPAKVSGLPSEARLVGEPPDQAPDLILETVVEDLDVKTALYARLESAYGGGPILGTNTSGLSLDALAGGLDHPRRFIGIHYFQPAEALPLVEVIRTTATTDEVFAAVAASLGRNGQRVLEVRKPVKGFLANRLQHAILHEAFSLIEAGVATAEDVDNFVKYLFGPRLSVTGLIEQKDISGLNVTAKTQHNLVPDLDHSGRPGRLLLDKVEAGDFGVSTGQGFYDWRQRDVEAHKSRAADKLARILAIVLEE